MKKTKEKKKRSLARKISNTFIALFAGLIILFLLLIGISQTSTFRNFVKDKITESVNSSINGKLYIGGIEGTLLSTLSIKDISLTDSDNETIFYSGGIDVRISIPRLLTRTLYFKEITVTEAELNLIEKENGQLNLATLSETAEEDTVDIKEDKGGSSFPFLIQINKLNLDNLRFVNKAYRYKEEYNTYNNINFEDLVIDSFDVSAKAVADLEENNYSLVLNNMSFSPNVYRFDLETLSGTFVYQNKNAVLRNFKMISDNSNININAKLDSVDFFNDFSLEKLESAPVDIRLSLEPFEFDDLSSFIPDTELLQHKVDLFLEASGSYGDLNVNRLNLLIKNSKLDINGNVKNLHRPEDLYLDVNINDSEIDYDDIVNLLPRVGLPEYNNLKLSDLNIQFTGKPTNFTAKLNSKSNRGSFSTDVTLNLDASPAAYDVKFTTDNLDLSPILGVNSLVNANGMMKGQGFDPVELNSQFDLTLDNSKIERFDISSLDITGNANQKIIQLDLSTLTNNSQMDVAGEVNFTQPNSPSYNLSGQIDNLNLASVLEDSSLQSNLNFNFGAVGKNFELDSLQGNFTVSLDSSTYREEEILQAGASLSIQQDTSGRNISVTSDFIDFDITGRFSLKDAVDVMSYQGNILADAISHKIEEFNPLYKEDTTAVETEVPGEIIAKELGFDYNFVFKDFSLIAVLLGERELDISGSGEGNISNNNSTFEITTDLNLDYLLKVNEEVFYISNLLAEFKLSRNNSSTEFENLFGSLSINCERFYSQTDIKNIQSDFIFNANNFFFNSSANINDQFDVGVHGNLNMTPRAQDIEIDDLFFVFNDVEFRNLRPVIMTLKVGESLDIEDFSVYNNNSAFHFFGIVYNDGRQDLQFDFNNVTGELISRLAGYQQGSLFDADLRLNGNLDGTFEQPVIDVNLAVDSVAYGESHFGSLTGNFNYADKNLEIDAAFADPKESSELPKLTLQGNVPVDLSYIGAEERIIEGKEIDLTLQTNDFNIAALGNTIPQLVNQRGILAADIELRGTLDDPYYSGKLELKNGYFVSALNNLEYDATASILFEDDGFTIDKITVRNAGNVPDKGTMDITGEGEFDGFILKNAEVRMNGDLTVLGSRSQAAQPSMYGRLFLGTDGGWTFKYDSENSYFTGNIVVKEADMVVIPVQEGSGASTNFKYVILEDTTNQDSTLAYLEEFVEKDKSKKILTEEEQELNLDYEITVNIPTSASLEIVLSQLANQKLIVDVTGNLTYEKMGDRTRAQGAFELMEGSKLEFFKTFEATGSIRFETDVTDPYLNVVATYKSEYTPPNSTEIQEVAVKLKLEGPVSQLGTNLANNPDNISVYTGTRDIENNVPDERYDVADAISFILVNRFKEDLTAQNRQEVANQTIGLNTAASFLGSFLTGYVNSAVGDAVNNIQIGQSGEYTKFNVSGRFSKFKYTIGSTTEYFDDINKATLRLDYLFSPNFLIRLERKDPVVTGIGIEDKITEMGIKYRFEF